MSERFKVHIEYVNGSTSDHPFTTYHNAQDFCRDGISYTGGRVKRVEIVGVYGSIRPIWDISWDAVSQREGLRHAI